MNRHALYAQTASVLALVWSSSVPAQSTSNVGGVQEATRMELSIGREFHGRSGTMENYSEKSVNAGTISVRQDPYGEGGFRLSLRAYKATQLTGFMGNGTIYTTQATDYTLGLTLASDWVFHPTSAFSLAPSTGLGVVPFMHSAHKTSSGDPPPSSATGVGLMFTTGITARFSHVIIEQELTGIVGPVRDMISNVYMPTMIGWRF